MAAVGALLLLAVFAGAAYADEDTPITAADAERTLPPRAGAGSAASPASSASPAASNAGTTGPSMLEAAPPKAPTLAAHADDSEPPMRPTFTTPAVPPIENPGNDAMMVTPPETQEIPQAMPEETPVAMVPPNTVPSSTDLSNYLHNDQDLESGVGSVRDFVAEGEESSAIGFEVRESRRKLKTGEEANGLLILRVDKDSAAARAGLRPYKRVAHNVLTAVAIGAAMIFPPVILAVPVIDYTEVGESYDMIIGVDGSRVTNFVDFEERMRNVQPGELVYFNLVRNGKRIQVPVPIPALSTSASN